LSLPGKIIYNSKETQSLTRYNWMFIAWVLTLCDLKPWTEYDECS